MLKIRQFSLSDLEEVMEIERMSFPNREVWPKDYFERLYLKYPAGFIVAENNGKIIGYMIGRPKNRVPVKWTGEIVSLAVDPDFRQKGIGTKLTNFLINHFKEKGIKEISLHVRARKKVAISFYQNFGFKTIKKIENYYCNGDDALLMKKSLGG
ncbi:MAG: ribosomal protein S18-alanine N-acetyltransferase [Patescibacteria group bacterium]|nr:ribosomal protein S18-alanine N-acetyltransferase [Patescibacteria group bacterium]